MPSRTAPEYIARRASPESSFALAALSALPARLSVERIQARPSLNCAVKYHIHGRQAVSRFASVGWDCSTTDHDSAERRLGYSAFRRAIHGARPPFISRGSIASASPV